jgi:hypothetical protein
MIQQPRQAHRLEHGRVGLDGGHQLCRADVEVAGEIAKGLIWWLFLWGVRRIWKSVEEGALSFGVVRPILHLKNKGVVSSRTELVGQNSVLPAGLMPTAVATALHVDMSAAVACADAPTVFVLIVCGCEM